VLPAGEARPPREIVGKLEIMVGSHHLEGGTGSVVNYKTVTLILTAKHLFGPGAGLSEVSPADMTRDVKQVTLHAATGGASFTSTRALYLGETESSDDDPLSVSRDVAAMLVDEPVRGLAFAQVPPKVGDRLWIEANDGHEVSVHVTESTPQRLAYHFDDQVLGMGSSGAPILNGAGELVGIHLRFGQSDGAGNPTASIVGHLEKRIR
jgi:hypothetical protein